MAWTFYNASGEALTNFGPTVLTDIDVANGSDVGAPLVDADEILIYDTSASANKKSDMSRIVTYVGADTDTRSGVAKVWAKWEQNGGDHTMADEYGVNTMVDGGAAGYSDMTFDTDFSSAAYSVTGSVEAAMIFMTEAASWAAGAITIRSADTAGTYTDATHLCVAIFGDH